MQPFIGVRNLSLVESLAPPSLRRKALTDLPVIVASDRRRTALSIRAHQQNLKVDV